MAPQPNPAIRTRILRPINGMWTKDPGHLLPDGASPDMSNFRVFQGILRKRPGYAKYTAGGTFPGAQITGIYSTQDTTGATHIFATTALHCWRYNTGTTNWDQSTGSNLAGSATDLFTFETSQNAMVFCQGVDNIQSLPLTGNTYAAIGATAFPSKYLTRFNNRLYASSTVEGGSAEPFRVRWSANGDHTTWNSIDAGFTDLQDDIYQMRNLRKLMDALAVYSEKGIWMAAKTGSAVGPAQYNLAVKDVGLLCSLTLQGYNVQHFFVGTDNFYNFNGIQLSPLLDGVRGSLYTLLNPSVLKQNFATLNYETQEYIAFLCLSSNTTPADAWVYNWSRGATYPWNFPNVSPTCITQHRGDNSLTIAQLVGTIAQQNWAFNSSFLTASYPLLTFGATNGNVYQFNNAYLNDDGNAINAYWTSRDFTASVDFGENDANYQICVKDIGVTYLDPGSQFTLQFYYSTDGGSTWQGPYPLTMGGSTGNAVRDTMLTQQATGKRVRFKIVNNSASENPQIIAFYPRIELKAQLIA